MQTTAQALVFSEACDKERKLQEGWEYDWGWLRAKPRLELPADYEEKKVAAARGHPVLAASAGVDLGSLITDPPHRNSAEVKKRFAAMQTLHENNLSSTAERTTTLGGSSATLGVRYPEQKPRVQEFAEWKSTMKTLPKATTTRGKAISGMKAAPTREELCSTFAGNDAVSETELGRTMMQVIERKLSAPVGKAAQPMSTNHEIGFLVAKGHDLEKFRHINNHGKKKFNI